MMKLRLYISIAMFFLAAQSFAQQEIMIPDSSSEFAEDEFVQSIIDNLITTENVPAKELYKYRWDNNNIRYSATEFVKSDEILTINLVGDEDTPYFHPVVGTTRFLSKYGPRSGRMHTGVDLSLNSGDPVYCAFDGVVRLAKRFSGYGNMVLVRHNNGLETLYGHLKSINVKVNQPVRAGDILGLGGRTGRATCNHLHFETRVFGEHFDPKKIIDFDLEMITCEHIYYKNHKVYNKLEDIKPVLVTPPSQQLASNNSKNTSTSDALSTAFSNATQHVIKRGDNLWTISQRYNISVKKLCAMNNISTKKILKIGEIIYVDQPED